MLADAHLLVGVALRAPLEQDMAWGLSSEVLAYGETTCAGIKMIGFFTGRAGQPTGWIMNNRVAVFVCLAAGFLWGGQAARAGPLDCCAAERDGLRVRLYQDWVESSCLRDGDYPNDLAVSHVYAIGVFPWECAETLPPVSYRKLSVGYELFSYGPDRLANTEDDIAPSMEWGACTYVWAGSDWKDVASGGVMDPVDRAGRELRDLRGAIGWMGKDTGQFPQSFEELLGWWRGVRGDRGANCFRALLRGSDPWGEPYVFQYRQWEVAVFSKGPDRTAGTDDDVFPGQKSIRCATDVCEDSLIRNGDSCGPLGAEWLDAANRTPVPDGVNETAAANQIKVFPSVRGCHCGFVGTRA